MCARVKKAFESGNVNQAGKESIMVEYSNLILRRDGMNEREREMFYIP